jgi:hypothetical protein
MSGRSQNNDCYNEEVGEPRRSRHTLDDARRARPEQAITSYSILQKLGLLKSVKPVEVTSS